MKINHKSKFAKFAPFIDIIEKESESNLKAQATEYYLPNGFWLITLGDFLNASKGDFEPFFGKKFRIDKLTVFQYYYILSFKDFVDEFVNILNNLSIKPSIDEAQAATNLTKIEFEEGFLVYAMKTFGYKSSSEAGGCILIDFIMRKKDDFNSQLFQRNMATIQERKIKRK